MEIRGRGAQERPGQMQRLHLLLTLISAFSFHTPRRFPDPLRSHPTPSLRDIRAVGSTLFSSSSKIPKSCQDAREDSLFIYLLPLRGFEGNSRVERLAAFGGCLGIGCVLISFLVYVYFPIRQRQSFLPYELYIQTITH